MKYFTIFFFLLSFSVRPSLAQDSKKKSKDFFNIKAPAIDYSGLDTSNILFEEEFSDTSEASRSGYFNLHKVLGVTNEDTNTLDEGELSIVEVSEEVKIDSTWITYAQYFAIWDSKTVNPYKINGAEFNDTLSLALYDSLSGFKWSMPLVNSRTTSQFGSRHYRWHYGIDLGLTMRDSVLAAFDGIVRINKYDPGGYGNYIMLRHYNGFETLYGHLTESQVEVGQLVKAGQLIGLGGNTGRSSGPHLHFEVRYEGNAIDPEAFYDFPNNRLRTSRFELMPSHFDYLKSARKVVYHKVRSGETLSTISRKYKIKSAAICKMNGISTRTTLRVGRKLRIR